MFHFQLKWVFGDFLKLNDEDDGGWWRANWLSTVFWIFHFGFLSSVSTRPSLVWASGRRKSLLNSLFAFHLSKSNMKHGWDETTSQSLYPGNPQTDLLGHAKIRWRNKFCSKSLTPNQSWSIWLVNDSMILGIIHYRLDQASSMTTTPQHFAIHPKVIIQRDPKDRVCRLVGLFVSVDRLLLFADRNRWNCTMAIIVASWTPLEGTVNTVCIWCDARY